MYVIVEKVGHARLTLLVCASLNTMDSTKVASPHLSFGRTQKNSTILMGSLPREAVCTENLTPWFKLLPCKTNVSLPCRTGKPDNLPKY
jgi:phosphatidylinositol glycan class T